MHTVSYEPILLIVEDDDILRTTLETTMRKRGFETCSASNVTDAQLIIAQKAPNCAIVDLHLGDRNGLEIVQELSKKCPHSKVIVLTGYGSIPSAVKAVHYGAVDYLAKPASADQLADIFRTPSGATTPPPTAPIQPQEARWEHIYRVFKENGENVSKAARSLKMHRRTLQRVLRRNGIADARNP